MMRLLDKKLFRGLVLTSIYLMGILGILASGGGGGGNGGDDDRITYRYNVTSASYLTGGQQVAVCRFSISGSCSNITGVTSSIRRVGSGTVKTPGTVSFSFKTKITPPMIESVYIDNNANGLLDYGDRVWGDNPNDLAAACFDTFNTDQTFDWEVVAAQIQAALGLSQPSIIYTGAPQAFRGDPGSLPEFMTESAIIVDGDGYDGIVSVTIDIKPASDLNSINPESKEVIPVAVLGSIYYDATQIDFTTVRFGVAEATPIHDGHVEDVNGDGFMDMVFHFKSQESGITCGDTEVILRGKTFVGIPFTGTDVSMTVGCE